MSLDPDLVRWLEARVGPGKEFSSVSNGIEKAVAELRARRRKRGS